MTFSKMWTHVIRNKWPFTLCSRLQFFPTNFKQVYCFRPALSFYLPLKQSVSFIPLPSCFRNTGLTVLINCNLNNIALQLQVLLSELKVCIFLTFRSTNKKITPTDKWQVFSSVIEYPLQQHSTVVLKISKYPTTKFSARFFACKTEYIWHRTRKKYALTWRVIPSRSGFWNTVPLPNACHAAASFMCRVSFSIATRRWLGKRRVRYSIAVMRWKR